MDITEAIPQLARLEIIYPKTDTPLGLTVFLYPPDHDILKGVQRRQTNKMLEASADRFTRRGGKKAAPVTTAEDQEESDLEYLVASVASWEWGDAPDGGKLTFKGEADPECTAANVRAVLTTPLLAYVGKQINQKLADDDAFFGKGSTS
jgi:hypothetical protein